MLKNRHMNTVRPVGEYRIDRIGFLPNFYKLVP
jgi:hypothetical protein